MVSMPLNERAGYQRLPKFCGHCGASLVAGEKRAHGSHFDRRTGQPTRDREYGLFCPKTQAWWRQLIGLAGSHDIFIVVERPDDQHSRLTITRTVLL